MIKSMTGYGRAYRNVDGMDITVEVKSVNHRYFDFTSRTQRGYGFLDDKLKTFFQKTISRGKVECFVQINVTNSENAGMNINFPLADLYVKALNDIAERYDNVNNDISVSLISKYPDVLTVCKDENEEEKIWNSVCGVAEKALESFIKMRTAEGEKLSRDISERCDTILKYVMFVEEKSPETVVQYREKLMQKMTDVLNGANVSEDRILTEAAIFADKVAVAEETVRLKSHIDQMRDFLLSEDSIGKKMDFLVQEMNREANTIGSKAQNIEITRTVLEIKSEIEKMREQIQNVE